MEGRARDARVIAVATEGDVGIERFADEVLWVPDTHEALSPILAIIPLQLFAYHTALARGTETVPAAARALLDGLSRAGVRA